MYFWPKCVGHELCYYYVSDVIVRVFNIESIYIESILLLCIYSVLYAYFEMHLLYYNVYYVTLWFLNYY